MRSGMQEEKCKQRRAGWRRKIFLLSFTESLEQLDSYVSILTLNVSLCLPGHGSLTTRCTICLAPSLNSVSFQRGDETGEKTQHWQRLQTLSRRVVVTHEQSSVRGKLNSHTARCFSVISKVALRQSK